MASKCLLDRRWNFQQRQVLKLVHTLLKGIPVCTSLTRNNEAYSTPFKTTMKNTQASGYYLLSIS